MHLWRRFKREFMVAFRLGLQRDPDAVEKLRQRREDQDADEAFAILLAGAKTVSERNKVLGSAPEHQRLAAMLAMARTDDERQQLVQEVARYVVDGSPEGTLVWSSNPGAHELHLKRRHNNPYFSISRRKVSGNELAEAKAMDAQDHALCKAQLIELISGIRATSPATVGDLQDYRERLEQLVEFCVGSAGPAGEIAGEATKLREALIADMRQAFAGDNDKLRYIDDADSLHKRNNRTFHVPLMAQLLRKDSPIPSGETIASLLSEDPATIATVMATVQDPGLRENTLRIFLGVRMDGYVDPQFGEKLSAISGDSAAQ